MKIITGLSEQPKQQSTLVLADGTRAVWSLSYVSQQTGWFYDLSWNGTVVATGQRMVSSPNILRQYINKISFGIAVVSPNQLEPTTQTALVDGTVTCYLLEGADLQAIETTIFNAPAGQVQPVGSTTAGLPVVVLPANWGPAGGDLAYAYPNPQVVAMHDGTGQRLAIATIADGTFLKRVGATVVGATVAPGTGDVTGPASSTIGNVALWADAAGTELSDGGTLGTAAFLPSSNFLGATASASGDLSGNYPSPKVAAITTGTTQLTIGAIADGEFLVRSGGTLIGSVPSGAGDVFGPSSTVTVGTVALFATTDGKNLGPSAITLGTIASQAANNVSISGGSIAGAAITAGAGGTINGVPINGSTIGAITASTGRFSSVTSTSSISAATTITATGNIGAANFSGSSSGNNTGDQTTITGNAATATALANARTIGGSSFNGTADVTSFPSPGPIGGTNPNTAVFTTLSSTQAATFATSSGNVGVGTASPSAKLDVRTVAGTAAAFNLYSGNNTTTAKISLGQIGSIDWDVGLTTTNGWFQIGGLGGTMTQAYTIARTGTSVLAHTLYTGGAARLAVTDTNVAIAGAVEGSNVLRTNGPATTDKTASAAIDYTSGFHRAWCWGPDASTIGKWKVRLARSDGSAAIEPVTIDSAGLAVTGSAGFGCTSTVATSIAQITSLGQSPTTGTRIAAAASDYLSTPTFTASFINQNGNSQTGDTCGLANAGLGSLYFQNTSAGVIWTNGQSPIVFGVQSVERMRIDYLGNVGIGTATPGYKLEVNGALGFTQFATAKPANPNIPIIYSASSLSGFNFGDLILQGRQEGFNNAHIVFLTGASSDERMRVSGNGNVGIGTASPAAKLHVSAAGFGGGNALFQSTNSGNFITIRGVNGTGVNDSAFISFEDGTGSRDAFIGLTGDAAIAGSLRFATNGNVERMRLNATGLTVTGTINGVTLTAGTGTPALTVNGTASISGGNTGDQTLEGLGGQPASATLTALAEGSAFVKFIGPTTPIKAFALPDANATILTSNAAVTVAQGGTGLTALGTAGQVLKVNAAGNALEYGSVSGSGTVTSVSVVNANGFDGTVATPTVAAAITLKTTVNGILKGNSTTGVVSAAAAGTDFQAPITLTTTGTSGAAAFTGNTLNIPQYGGIAIPTAAGNKYALLGRNIAEELTSTANLTWYGPYVFNVKDFGAVGNGVANDTAAVQAAATAAVAKISSVGTTIPFGASLYFPAGTYRIAGTLSTIVIGSAIDSDQKSLTITGDGPGVSHIFQTTDNAGFVNVELANRSGRLNVFDLSVWNVAATQQMSSSAAFKISVTEPANNISHPNLDVRNVYVGGLADGSAKSFSYGFDLLNIRMGSFESTMYIGNVTQGVGVRMRGVGLTPAAPDNKTIDVAFNKCRFNYCQIGFEIKDSLEGVLINNCTMAGVDYGIKADYCIHLGLSNSHINSRINAILSTGVGAGGAIDQGNIVNNSLYSEYANLEAIKGPFVRSVICANQFLATNGDLLTVGVRLTTGSTGNNVSGNSFAWHRLSYVIVDSGATYNMVTGNIATKNAAQGTVITPFDNQGGVTNSFTNNVFEP